MYGVRWRWLPDPYESCGLDLVFLTEESVESLAEHRGSIRAAADIAYAHEKD